MFHRDEPHEPHREVACRIDCGRYSHTENDAEDDTGDDTEEIGITM